MAGQQRRTTADAVRTVVAPPVEAAGLYLEHVAVSRAGNRSVVRITVDLPEESIGSLGTDALGEVSRDVSAALDARDVVPGQYVLEVSTPGTSRPLTEPRHFRRARTRLVTLWLHDGGAVSGRLVDVVDGEGGPSLVLADGTRVAVADVAKGRVDVELKRADDGAGDDGGSGDGVQGDDTTGDARDEQDAGSARDEEG